MKLDRISSLNLVSVVALTISGCASKTVGSNDGIGGASFQTDGGSNAPFDPNTYCNGLFKNQSCAATIKRADLKIVNMLLVIDESGSMNAKASSTAANTKWADMKQALSTALTSVQDSINFGLKLFPYDPNGIGTDIQSSCAVPTGPDDVNVDIAPGTTNLQKIIDLVNAQTPGGGTPTTSALTQAYAYFTQGKGKDLEGSKWVLLATDGGPNCNSAITCTKETCTQNMDLTCAGGIATTTVNCCDTTGQPNANMSCLDDVAVVKQIATLAGVGVGTYVIGIPGSEAYAATLNKMAQAGGVPNKNGTNGELYYAVSAANPLGDLTKAFEDITSKFVKSCDITLSSSPRDPTLVQVAKDCELIPMLPGNKPTEAGADGFFVDYGSNPAHLMLTGRYCDNISTVGATTLDVIEGCIPPP